MTSIASATPIMVTPEVLATTMVQGLTTDQTAMATLEEQISTGDAINAPSDNPAGAANLLQLQGALTRANQYAANAQDGVGWLSLGNSTVSSVLDVVQNIKSVIEGVSGSSLMGEPSTITSTADQVQSALSQLLDLANTTEEGGQPIFAGTGSSTAAYDANGNYLGNSVAPTRTVAPGTRVAIAVTGPEVFGPANGTTDAFGGASTSLLSGAGTTTDGPGVGVLQTLVNDLTSASTDLSAGNRAGATAALSQVTGTDLQNLSAALDRVETAAGVLGANQQEVQGFSTQATDTISSLQQELGSVQDTNMAQALTNLQLQQTAYQEALYATSQLSSDSLAKYL